MTQNQVPITRLGKFFGQEDFDLDVNMGREWLDGDMNFTIVVYRVNKQKQIKMMCMVRLYLSL